MAGRPARGESGDSPVDPKSYERISTQLSALLAEMVRAQEVAVADSWSPEVQPGGSIGRFRLVRELGRGGFGVVYEALDGDLNRTVALKVVRPGTRVAARGSQWLLREAEAVARLNHPNIVTLHDFGQGPTGPYLVFEMLRGRSLAERLRAGPLPLDEVIDLGVAVSRALVHAHGAGVIHRDLTAGNVHQGEDGAVKVLDFGLAHLFGRDGANDGGTPAYMAPEQWEGDRGDARTDLFALGVILHQSLSGSFPYRVDKGWSEALEPGETPRLPRGAAPAPVRRLVRSLIEREPSKRPESARLVRDAFLALRRARDGAGRRRLFGAAAALALAAVATACWLYFRHEAPPGEEVKVLLAAMENGAGEPVLEAFPGLLSAALEMSPRVKIVPQARLAYLSRQAGMGEPGRLYAARGRELARVAGAAVLLVPSSRQEGGRMALEVQAVEASTGRIAFRVGAELQGSADLDLAVDGLSDRIRKELFERGEDRRQRRPVSETVTASPEAALSYFQGVACRAHPSAARGNPAPCQEYFLRALALDPAFPLAHYQLASLSPSPGDLGERALPHLEAALQALDRLPAREALFVKALSARVEGRNSDALRIYDQLLSSTPEDAVLLETVADLYAALHDWQSAARYLEKWVAVEPGEELPQRNLVEALGRSNRADALRSLLSQLDALGSARALPLVEAHIWLGEPEEAVRVARRAVKDLGEAELDTLRLALQAAGEYGEVEAVARSLSAAKPSSKSARYRVGMALTAQGRLKEAMGWLSETSRFAADDPEDDLGFREATAAAAYGRAEPVWRHAAPLHATSPKSAAPLAVVLALLGDLPHADELARDLEAGSIEAQQYAALRAWRDGDVAGALARLALLESRDPWPKEGIAPAYLMAEVSAASGDDVGTLAAIDRFLRLPSDLPWRAFAYPRSLYLSAVAHERLGEREAARRSLERLQRLLERADPGVALEKEARTLEKRL